MLPNCSKVMALKRKMRMFKYLAEDSRWQMAEMCRVLGCLEYSNKHCVGKHLEKMPRFALSASRATEPIDEPAALSASEPRPRRPHTNAVSATSSSSAATTGNHTWRRTTLTENTHIRAQLWTARSLAPKSFSARQTSTVTTKV